MSNELLICPVCGLKTEFLSTNHIKMHGFANAKEFKNKFNLSYLKSARIRFLQSEFMKENNPTKGMKRTPEEVIKMSSNRKGKGIGKSGKYERTPTIKAKISNGVAKAHLEGRLQGYPMLGEYVFSKKMNRNMWCHSTYEVRLVRLFDIMPNIMLFKREPCAIQYTYNGAVHNFIPDFWVKEDCGIEWLFEFKMEYEWNLPKVVAKTLAMYDYCKLNNLNACFIGKNLLEKYEIANAWRLRHAA